ncbi:MAG TPA: type II restriction endonuclease [Pseudomonadales bacterium]
MAWMEREEILFRTLEKHIIGERLVQGFDGDVDGFISISLSVQNRRKSRAGLAFENHLEILFQECGIRYSRTPVTEHKSKPDFIFPGEQEYRDRSFDSLRLTMLGVKSSCKDRWRQVLAEADRIEKKHLLTLEAAISKNQTDEMQSKKLQLVLPRGLHNTYSAEQQSWLMDVSGFTTLVLDRQSGYE